ncbi:TetR/AcrR family transcriptional regulator [Nonomuraea sp. B12E4]|uniref:TetR/AcrR family transcriptional regulator n=1 Tax=Nonomuraea sp. B12E4 TaxID=3153564 RepID=UPI00325C609C
MPKNPERRDQLGDVALEVLASEGSRGLTHRAVDQRAGLPAGTTANYYPSRETLLTAAAERINARRWKEYQARWPISHVRTGPEGLSDALCETLRAALTTNRERCLAVLELSLEATRRPDLGELIAQNRRAQEKVVEGILQASGAHYGQADLVALTTWVYGTILWLLTRPPSEPADDQLLASLSRTTAYRFWHPSPSSLAPHEAGGSVAEDSDDDLRRI